jgi:hypothetical protein
MSTIRSGGKSGAAGLGAREDASLCRDPRQVGNGDGELDPR